MPHGCCCPNSFALRIIQNQIAVGLHVQVEGCNPSGSLRPRLPENMVGLVVQDQVAVPLHAKIVLPVASEQISVLQQRAACPKDPTMSSHTYNYQFHKLIL